ncbi:unnamed protein product [Camellia sinensis]
MYAEYTDCYYSGDDKSTALTGRKEMVFMANLCAFQFWQRVYKDKLRLDQLKQLLHFDEMKAALLLAPEEEWCSFHNLVHPSLNHVAEIYEDILNSVHRFRPKFLATADGLPLYYEPYEFQHTCLLTCQKNGNTDTMAADDEHSELPNEKRKCNSVPFVPSSYFLSHEVAENLATIIKEVRVQCTEHISGNEYKYVNGDGPPAPWEPSLCKFFVKGLCNRGNQCSFSHSLQAKRSVCKFFLSLKLFLTWLIESYESSFKQNDLIHTVNLKLSLMERVQQKLKIELKNAQLILLNVYAPKFETGGTFWPLVHSPAFVFLYQFSLLYSMTIAGNIFYPYSKLILLRYNLL